MPCLSIKGLSPPVPCLFTGMARGKLKVAVALLPAVGETLVKPLTGTTCAALKPSKKYYTIASKGTKQATSMTAEEYTDFASAVLERLKGQRRRLVWIHDRDTAHLRPVATEQLQNQKHLVKVLPPRSPDMDPLDYAVFGHSKQWLRRNARAQNMSWDEQCSAFIKHLEGLDPRRQIAGFRKRLEMVIRENGGHIEHKL